MNENYMNYGMRNANYQSAIKPVLQSVQAHGRLHGLLFELTVRQLYRNTSSDVLEVVYTFPLAMGAVLLGMQVEIEGKRLSGQVVERHQAEVAYEEAMATGDAPIMLERSGDGLYTMNLGNIKPGEEVVVEYRYAQLLTVEQGQVRLCIPTTIAPRYGDPVADGKLQPHQAPHTSGAAQHGLKLELALEGGWARAGISCASHISSTEASAERTMLRLSHNAWLDRDVVITLSGAAQASTALCKRDGEQHVVLASFQPASAGARVEQLDIKLLVDCSGSMEGASIASAKTALGCVARQFGALDRFTFSRFGSNVVHGFRRLTPARGTNLAMLHALIDTTDANLGGTEMHEALASTIKLAGTGESADILLITDGEVWNVEPMIADATASKHRVFIVGVGSAPAESALRRLAAVTGGACEFATPGEDLEAAIERMFARIRQQERGAIALDWTDGAHALTPQWVAGLPHAVFDGDTVHVFAGFAGTPPAAARLTHGASGGEAAILGYAAVAPRAADGDALARMAAWVRLPAVSQQDALALALRYQLVTKDTNFIVVHQRAEGEQTVDMAHLHSVPQMVAAGVAAPAPGLMRKRGAGLHLSRGPMAPCAVAPMPVNAPLAASMDMAMRSAVQTITREQLARTALKLLAADPGVKLAAAASQLQVDQMVMQCVHQLVALGVGIEAAWTLVVRWLAELEGILLDTATETALDTRLAQVSSEQWRDAMEPLEHLLGSGQPAA